MGRADMYYKKIPATAIEGRIHIPSGLKSDPRFIIPDEIVDICARRFNLFAPSMHGIDPMCGIGTIPRVIHANGGTCDGIDIDPYQYSVTKKELPESASLVLGDCLKMPITKTYDYIYTSIPFIWFKDVDLLDDLLATTFRRMLKPGGFLLIDSDDVAQREVGSWPLADNQITYFTSRGFRFDEVLRFKREGFDGIGDVTFTEIKLSLEPLR